MEVFLRWYVMKINKILNFSSVDGPGNRLVVFFQGCNFNCIYCHNPETIDYEKEGYFITPEEMVQEVLKAKDFIRGVTFTGGECTLQYEELARVADMLDKHDIEVYIDTNFSLDPAIYSYLSKSVKKFIVDLKAFNNKNHIVITGYSNNQILENIRAFYDKIYEVRIVIVPGYNDSDEEVVEMLEFLYTVSPDIRITLIRFRPYGVREEFGLSEIPSIELMEYILDIGKKIGLKNIYYK